MKRTGATVLLVSAVLGALCGFGLDHLLTQTGRATFTPGATLPILLLMLGAACIALAWPIRRSLRSADAPRVDPFRALRIAMLAKASAIVGAVMAGAAIGLAVYLFSRPVSPQVGSLGALIATFVAAVLLVAAALVAEHFCILPKDPDDTQPDTRAGPSV